MKWKSISHYFSLIFHLPRLFTQNIQKNYKIGFIWFHEFLYFEIFLANCAVSHKGLDFTCHRVQFFRYMYTTTFCCLFVGIPHPYLGVNFSIHGNGIFTRLVFHSSKIKGLCLMILSSKILQNFLYLWTVLVFQKYGKLWSISLKTISSSISLWFLKSYVYLSGCMLLFWHVWELYGLEKNLI